MAWRAWDDSCQVFLTFPGLFLCWPLFPVFGYAFFYLYGPANSLSVLPKFFESSVFKGIVCKVRLACEAIHLPVVLTTC